METIINKPEKLVIRTEISESLANAVRRSISEIPTLAVDEVEIFKNDSALYDEVLAHRIGLVSLKTEKGMSEKTKIDFKLSKKGPCTVYSGDFEGGADIVFKNIPLTILNEDHKLEIVATAKLGKGIVHSKHTPGLCFYRHLTEVKSSPKIDEIVSKSSGLIKPEKKGSKWLADLSDLDLHKIEEIDKEAASDSSELLLIIESFGMMPAKDILTNAIKVLSDNLDDFEDKIK